ncbi:hypothetical protein HPO96_10355 [Kribbella sandramycini]|uniref:Uncharacterized protein n=1 Tax=Kribbella sandramycini TaxID=60450 RepID=A0A7Y4KZE1_9ACTN|nr:DUF6177 family protein [Kribbella sandramycini]MBB6569520.1 hypothetical protein [Kribbella sandramycini]NOL40646.1 hypothetical protein [Kribbella sandramycini]
MPNSLTFSPGVDLITEKVAVVMQDRPVIGMSAWLSDALISAKVEARDIQLVTPKTSRLTYPVRSKLFNGMFSRWVVTTDDGEYFDGLNGVRLKWNGEMFLARTPAEPGEEAEPTSDLHPDFVVKEVPHCHLQLTVRVRHAPVASLVLGGVAERLFNGLTGGGPSGWSTSEPVTQLWNPTAMTDYCRGRAPSPTWLVLSGQPGPEFKPAVGTLETRRTESGLDETITMSVAQPGLEQPSLEEIGQVVDDVADDYELISAAVVGAFGAADGTYQPRFLGMSSPMGIAAGNEAVGTKSVTDLLQVEGVKNAMAIGPAHNPALWYPIGNGQDPADWTIYANVMQKLLPTGAGEK